MSRVLLVDTNVSAAPIYDYLVQAGHEVFVCGANPADFLAKVSANYIGQDYSDVDGMRKLVDTLSVDYLVPGCNDRSYQICVELNSDGQFHGLDGREAATTIRNKRQFREFAGRAGLPVPHLVSSTDVGAHWPVIVKPVDAFSGRGVTVLHEAEKEELTEARRHAEEYSGTRSCIVEEYVEGQLYSHSAFILGGQVLVDFIVEEHGTANPFVVDTSRVVPNFSPAMLERLRECVTVMAERLHLTDGLVHTQFIRNDDAFWLIEITRRCPGDLYSQLIESTTGFRYVEAYVRPFLGQSLIRESAAREPSWVMRHTVSLPTDGVMGSLRFNIPVRVERLVPLCLAGDMVRGSPFGKIALLFAGASSEAEFSALFEAALDRKLYEVDHRY